MESGVIDRKELKIMVRKFEVLKIDCRVRWM